MKSWLSEPKLKNWLTCRYNNKTKMDQAYRNVCCRFEFNLKHGLIRHGDSKTHLESMEEYASTSQERAMMARLSPNKEDQKVTAAEVRLAALLCEKNIPLSFTDSLIPVLKKCFDDSKILQRVKLGKQKCSSMIQQGIISFPVCCIEE